MKIFFISIFSLSFLDLHTSRENIESLSRRPHRLYSKFGSLVSKSISLAKGEGVFYWCTNVQKPFWIHSVKTEKSVYFGKFAVIQIEKTNIFEKFWWNHNQSQMSLHSIGCLSFVFSLFQLKILASISVGLLLPFFFVVSISVSKDNNRNWPETTFRYNEKQME